MADMTDDMTERWFNHLARLSEYDAKCEILRGVLVELNHKRLGEPDRKILAALLGITDVDQLTRMNVHASKASTWQEVLETLSTWQEVWGTPKGDMPVTS